ncbi:hypothetical protein E2C01_057962 [Portunus trituberculatus]|uniref:Uncharacterized protein n=1 Tax=Portunus trituberculatus TaxID=210409 RepID=A0A5B7H2H8_PORTR|nr:hypothetical protein [Portunus trituberculatus]
MEAKVTGCICTAKALAGSNVRHLQVLIPLLLKHNNLPSIRIPHQAFGASHTPKPPKSQQPLLHDIPPCREEPIEEPVEEAPTVEEEEEDEIVDVEGCDSDSDQPPPDIEPPPKEEGWTTTKNKKKKKKPMAAEAEPTPHPSPRRETANKDDEEELHTTHYQLRSKNPETSQEDPGPSKISLSDLLLDFNKFKDARTRQRTNQQH